MKAKCVNCSKEWGGISPAHCSSCHKTFVTANAFDKHQSLKRFGVRCLDPSTVGLVYDKAKDHYRFMSPDEERDSVICDPCKEKKHDRCKGCTCQHRPPAQTLGVVGIASSEQMGEIGG